MAGASAVTWNEVAAWVAASPPQALWKAGAQAGNSCLTYSDFNAYVINNGAYGSSNSLITYDQFMASRLVAGMVYLLSSIDAVVIEEYDTPQPGSGAPTRSTTLGSTGGPSEVRLLPSTRSFRASAATFERNDTTVSVASNLVVGQDWTAQFVREQDGNFRMKVYRR